MTQYRHAPYDTFLRSILENYHQCQDWLHANYINIYIENDGNFDNFFDFRNWFHCPLIQTSRIERPILKLLVNNFSAFTGFIEDCISTGNYIYLVVNTKFIEQYGMGDWVHNLIIYGFDSYSKEIFFSDFINGQYSLLKCSYINMFKAFNHYDDVKNEDPNTCLWTLKFCSDRTFGRDLNLIYHRIEDYFNSINLNQKYNFYDNYDLNDVYGLKFYDQIIKLYKIGYASIRPLNLIYMRNILMKKRLDYLKANNSISEFKEIYSKNNELTLKSLILRNRFLYYRKRGIGFNDSMEETIHILQKMDKILSNQILNCLIIK